MVSVLSSCTETCGWIAAVVAMFSFGSFGVPLKTSINVEVNFLVMQSYKTLVCFCTSWLVLLLGEEVRWSNWGIASGLFWVPGAACGIYGIRNAGLAIAVGTWSSIIVITSFIVGILIFEEKVKSFTNTCFAFIVLIMGLIGMSRYSAHVPDREGKDPLSPVTRSSFINHAVGGGPLKRTSPVSSSNETLDTSRSSISANTNTMVSLEMESLVGDYDDEADIMGHSNEPHAHAHHDDDFDTKGLKHKDRLVFFGGRISLTRRELGILGAVVNGAWGGMNLVPLHFALRDDGLTGAGYLISYATGALIVNISIWILLYSYYLFQKKGQWQEALECLPKWHVEQLWRPGLYAGLLYSLGNFSAIIAVTHLGQSTGYSFCQMQIFVSGLWGVFYFKEVSSLIIVWSGGHVPDSVGHSLKAAQDFVSHTLYIFLFFHRSEEPKRSPNGLLPQQ